MRKARMLVLAAVLLSTAVGSRHGETTVLAQSASLPTSCSGTFAPSPMQGQYSGPWHSDGDYHFDAWGTDLRLQIIIDGTLDVVVNPDGSVTGSATGTLNAPITHDGITDVSSGYGTIRGMLSGTLTPSGPLLVLHAPVIDMHWGTFVGGGYTVERYITMPDYTFSVGADDCISASGTIGEQGFPTMAIVADGGNRMTYEAGTGPATGSWNLEASGAAQYEALSSRVDSFITMANGVLAGPGALLTSAVDAEIATPLKSLVTDIEAHPDTARCLLERLASWETSAVSALMARTHVPGTTHTLPAFRVAGDALRGARDIDLLCGGLSSSAGGDLSAALMSALGGAVADRHWADAASLSREALLLGFPVQSSLGADLHGLLATTSSSSGLTELARVAYAFGDDGDASAAYTRVTATRSSVVSHKKTKHHHKKKPTPKATPRPTAKPTPRPTLTPTLVPKPSMEQVLARGVAAMHVTVSGSTASWSPVAGAQMYVLTVVHPSGLVWSWAGSLTTTQVGDTTVENLSGSSGDLPPAIDVSGGSWTVLALDATGAVIGADFRAKP